MPIPLALAIAAGAPALYKTISGARQAAAAKKAERQLKRPTLAMPEYKVPEQVSDVTKNVKRGALDTRLPGQDIAEAQIAAGTANIGQAARQAGGSSAGALSAIAQANALAAAGTRDLSLAAAKRYDEMQSDVNQALMNEAQYADRKQALDTERYLKEFEYNQAQPFQSQAAQISALRGAANQNIYGGLSDLASLGAMLARYPSGGKKTPTASDRSSLGPVAPSAPSTNFMGDAYNNAIAAQRQAATQPMNTPYSGSGVPYAQPSMVSAMPPSQFVPFAASGQQQPVDMVTRYGGPQADLSSIIRNPQFYNQSPSLWPYIYRRNYQSPASPYSGIPYMTPAGPRQ